VSGMTAQNSNVGTSDEPIAPVPTLSLCMIVRNEERVLRDCLESIRPWVDEIIVVDTGSADRTVEIAEELGAKLFHFPWCDDFSAARNESLRHATGDWIFWMDADDVMPAQCGPFLRRLAAAALPQWGAYTMQVHVPAPPGETGLVAVDQVKLFRNHPSVRFAGRIHEQVTGSVLQTGKEIVRSDLFVLHSNTDRSRQGQERKRERYSHLLKLELQDRPESPFAWFNLGMHHFEGQEFEETAAALKRCLELEPGGGPVRQKAYALLTASYGATGNTTRAIGAVEEGLMSFPEDAELLFRAGMIYHQARNLPAAERSYLKIIQRPMVAAMDSVDLSLFGAKPHHNLALVYQDQSRYEEARAEWQAALAIEPDHVPSLVGLGWLCIGLQQFEEARRIVERLQRVAPEHVDGIAASIPQDIRATEGSTRMDVNMVAS
jgi:glycosyl transferase family 2/tetratricopeptide repeat protein